MLYAIQLRVLQKGGEFVSGKSLNSNNAENCLPSITKSELVT